MRALLYALSVVTILVLLTSSCGNSGELGTVAGNPVTTDEYLSVFNSLPAAMQVSVLEPGGRLELMNRIVMKRLLLTAWEEDVSVSAGWEDLYRTSMLADSMFNRIGFAFDQYSYIDSMTACGFSDFSLRVVLLDDSASAAEMALEWNNNNYESSVVSMSAPWSLADGSSYRVFCGPVQRITDTFLPLLTMTPDVAHVLPMYGEWCVCLLNLTEGDWIPDDGATSLGFMSVVAKEAPYTILSSGITILGDNCTVSGTRIVPAGDGNQEPVILFGENILTVADILDIMKMADPINFPDEVSREIAIFSPPEILINAQTTLWFYVEKVAQKHALSSLAEETGIALPENALDFARAESVIRTRVLEASIPDSAGVATWFEQNSEIFLVPERRSVLLCYTPASTVNDSITISGFDELEECQTVVDQNGDTPPQAEQAFGSVLGSAIFTADLDVFSGPFQADGELVAWFKVVEIVPAQTALLEDIYPQVEMMAASIMFSSEYDNLIDDLYEGYSVTIDTAAVTEIDLWGGAQ